MASASTQTVEIPERAPEKVDEHPHFSSPETKPQQQPFVIRLTSVVPG